MSPSLTTTNQTDESSADTMFAGQCAVGGSGLADGDDRGFGEFRLTVLLTTCPRLSNRSMDPPLVSGVGHVVGMGTEEQVVGSDAVPDIAVVTDEESRWDRTVFSNPREAMNVLDLAVLMRLSVAVLSDESGPQPAGFGLVDGFRSQGHGTQCMTVVV